MTKPVAVKLMMPNNPRAQAGRRVIQAMAAEAGLRHEDPSRPSSRPRSTWPTRATSRPTCIGWSGRADPDGNIYSFDTCKGGAERRAATAIPRSTSCSTRRARSPTRRAQGALRAGAASPARRTADHLPLPPPWLSRHRRSSRASQPYPDGMIRLKGVKFAS